MAAVECQPADDVFEGPETQKHINTHQVFNSRLDLVLNDAKRPLTLCLLPST